VSYPISLHDALPISSELLAVGLVLALRIKGAHAPQVAGHFVVGFCERRPGQIVASIRGQRVQRLIELIEASITQACCDIPRFHAQQATWSPVVASRLTKGEQSETQFPVGSDDVLGYLPGDIQAGLATD